LALVSLIQQFEQDLLSEKGGRWSKAPFQDF